MQIHINDPKYGIRKIECKNYDRIYIGHNSAI